VYTGRAARILYDPATVSELSVDDSSFDFRYCEYSFILLGSLVVTLFCNESSCDRQISRIFVSFAKSSVDL
jgi:hypothetical protein